MKKIPLRMCTGCGEMKPKKELIRVVRSPEGEISRIATVPEKRGRGIAYRLLDYAVKCERGHGLETLFLEVRSQNAPACALYRSYGFREMGIRKNYYKNPTDDAVIMLKQSRADAEFV